MHTHLHPCNIRPSWMVPSLFKPFRFDLSAHLSINCIHLFDSCMAPGVQQFDTIPTTSSGVINPQSSALTWSFDSHIFPLPYLLPRQTRQVIIAVWTPGNERTIGIAPQPRHLYYSSLSLDNLFTGGIGVFIFGTSPYLSIYIPIFELLSIGWDTQEMYSMEMVHGDM